MLPLPAATLTGYRRHHVRDLPVIAPDGASCRPSRDWRGKTAQKLAIRNL